MFYKDNILQQFQTHQAESGKDDNYSDDETVNDVAPEWHSRFVVESAPDVLKNAALYSKTEDEMQSFLLNLLSRKKLFAWEQTNITGFFSKVG